MRAPGAVLGLLMLIALMAIAVFMLSSNHKMNPLGPNPGVPPLETSQPSPGPLPHPQSPTPPGTAGNGNANGNGSGNGNGTNTPAGDGNADVAPVPDPGSVRFTFRLPEGASEPQPFELQVTAPGGQPHSPARWSRRAPAQKRSKEPYIALFGRMAPGEHELWVDFPGLGSAGTLRVSVRSSEETVVEVPEIFGYAEYGVAARHARTGEPVAGTYRFEAAGAAGVRAPRSRSGTVGPDGKSPLLEMLPGNYVLSFFPERGAPVFKRTRLERGTTGAREVLTIDDAARVALTVRDAAGQPASLFVRLAGEGGVRFTRHLGTELELVTIGGQLDIARAPTGSWAVEASRHRGGPYVRLGTLALAPGETTAETYTFRD